MPKIKKDGKDNKVARRKQLEQEKVQLKYNMYKSAVSTYILAFIFLVVSFVFNGGLLAGWVKKVNEIAPDGETSTSIFKILDIIIRSISVIMFFWFTLVSVGNWQELRGYILTWKEMTAIIVLTLFQTTLNGTVFAITLIGVSIILMYMYFIQGKIETELEF